MNLSKKKPLGLWGYLSLVFLFIWPLGIVLYKFLEKKEKKLLLSTQKPLAVIGWIYVFLALMSGSDNFGFWIVLVLLIGVYVNLGNKKGQNTSNHGVIVYSGYLSIGAAVFLWLFMLIAYKSESLGIGMYCMAGGLVLLLLERMERQKACKFQQYLDYVLKRKTTSIMDLSLLFQNNPAEIVRDLNEMVNAGYFGDAYVDRDAQKIVFPHLEKEKKKQQERKVTVTCKHCGATNMIIIGEHNVCEYCDSPIMEMK